MVALVERMLALQVQLAAAKTPTAKTALQRQTWRELAERSPPPTARSTAWSTSCMA